MLFTNYSCLTNLWKKIKKILTNHLSFASVLGLRVFSTIELVARDALCILDVSISGLIIISLAS